MGNFRCHSIQWAYYLWNRTRALDWGDWMEPELTCYDFHVELVCCQCHWTRCFKTTTLVNLNPCQPTPEPQNPRGWSTLFLIFANELDSIGNSDWIRFPQPEKRQKSSRIFQAKMDWQIWIQFQVAPRNPRRQKDNEKSIRFQSNSIHFLLGPLTRTLTFKLLCLVDSSKNPKKIQWMRDNYAILVYMNYETIFLFSSSIRVQLIWPRIKVKIFPFSVQSIRHKKGSFSGASSWSGPSPSSLWITMHSAHF